jgi:hypothetical protein
MATMGLRKTHEIFNELNAIPSLNGFSNGQRKGIHDRSKTLKERYKDNKSYVRGMDEQAHHILGYSRLLDPTLSNSELWAPNGSRRKNC